MVELYLKWQQEVKFIDIRTSDELLNGGTDGEAARGFIPGAINVDYYAPDFREQLMRLDRNVPYVIYCRTGFRSASTVSIMRELSFTEIYSLAGGFMEWKAQGYPVEYKVIPQ